MKRHSTGRWVSGTYYTCFSCCCCGAIRFVTTKAPWEPLSHRVYCPGCRRTNIETAKYDEETVDAVI